MPRFSELEREQIQNRLMSEGERLFRTYGLKKVTIDDIAQAVKIAKASFYRFYEGKEYLYLDIIQQTQTALFRELEESMEQNKACSNKRRVKQVFQTMYQLLPQYPILAMIDEEVIEMISRKISSDRMRAFYAQRKDLVMIMMAYGVEFKYDHQTISCTFNTLYQSWISLKNQDEKVQEKVIDILLEGMIEQVVSE